MAKNELNDQWASGSFASGHLLSSTHCVVPFYLSHCFFLNPLLFFLFFDNLLSQIYYCLREMSHYFQVFPPLYLLLTPCHYHLSFSFSPCFSAVFVNFCLNVSNPTLTPGEVLPNTITLPLCCTSAFFVVTFLFLFPFSPAAEALQLDQQFDIWLILVWHHHGGLL